MFRIRSPGPVLSEQDVHNVGALIITSTILGVPYYYY